MSLLDERLIYGESFTLVGATAGGYTTNILNHGIGEDAFGTAQTPDIGNGGNIYWNVTCEDTDFAGASGTVTIDLKTSAVEAMSSATTLVTFATDETPNDGDVLKSIAVPAGTVKQYTGTYITVGTASMTGAVTAFLSGTPLLDKRLS